VEPVPRAADADDAIVVDPQDSRTDDLAGVDVKQPGGFESQHPMSRLREEQTSTVRSPAP